MLNRLDLRGVADVRARLPRPETRGDEPIEAVRAILRDVREDSRRGRLYIPLDELRRYGVNLDEIMGSRTNDRIRALLRFQADRARSYYRKAFELLPAADRYAQRGGLAMAAIYLETLRQIAADDYNVLERRTSLTPVRKLWIAWRTWLTA